MGAGVVSPAALVVGSPLGAFARARVASKEHRAEGAGRVSSSVFRSGDLRRVGDGGGERYHGALCQRRREHRLRCPMGSDRPARVDLRRDARFARPRGVCVASVRALSGTRQDLPCGAARACRSAARTRGAAARLVCGHGVARSSRCEELAPVTPSAVRSVLWSA